MPDSEEEKIQAVKAKLDGVQCYFYGRIVNNIDGVTCNRVPTKILYLQKTNQVNPFPYKYYLCDECAKRNLDTRNAVWEDF